MGVDPGLPDFWGTAGFWKAYPALALAQAQVDFHSIASPRAFRADPTRAWGFYGHRRGPSITAPAVNDSRQVLAGPTLIPIRGFPCARGSH